MLLTSPISFPNLGITVDPSPVAFTVMGKDIYWYGIIIAGGFLLAVLYMMYRAKTFGITQDDVLDLVLWAVPIGVICARLYYCVFYWDLYRDNPISMLYIWEGGLAIYGGIIGGAITVLVLSRVKKIPPLVMLDNAAMGVIIGQILGRWGNFMNREAHGSVTDSFFKMGLADAAGKVTYYHPTFLYESVWNLVGFIGLHFYCKKRKFDGEVFLLYVAWYGLGRAWIEGLRTDSLYLFSTGIRVSQLVAAVSFLAAAGIIGGAITLLVVAKRKKIPAPVLLDVAGMGVIIGQLMGRWGNFMNREAHGAVTDTFLKMGLQDASGVVTYYHPTFLYESVWNLIGFIGLHFFSKKRKFDGEVFLAYVAWYGLGRVWIEGLRTDSLYLFSTGIRVSQLVAAVSFLAAAGILAWVLVKKKPARESLYVNRKREEPQADEKQAD